MDFHDWQCRGFVIVTDPSLSKAEIARAKIAGGDVRTVEFPDCVKGPWRSEPVLNKYGVWIGVIAAARGHVVEGTWVPRDSAEPLAINYPGMEGLDEAVGHFNFGRSVGIFDSHDYPARGIRRGSDVPGLVLEVTDYTPRAAVSAHFTSKNKDALVTAICVIHGRYVAAAAGASEATASARPTRAFSWE